jgi:hypothetical protein
MYWYKRRGIQWHLWFTPASYTLVGTIRKNNKQYIYNEQTNSHLMDSLLHCSLFIAPTYFNANTSSSGSFYALPAKLHKRVHAVLVVFLKNFHIRLFRTITTLKLS